MCKKKFSDAQSKICKFATLLAHIVAIFARQSGKSTALAIWCLWKCLWDNKEYKTDDGHLHIHIFAPIEEQAFIIFDKIKLFTKNNPMILAFVNEGETRWRGGYLAFNNGNTIQVFSASEQAHIRGHSPAIIVIDESQDLTEKKYWQDILPSGSTTGAKIVEAGTPKGRNHFYRHTLPVNKNDIQIIYQKHTECYFMDKAYVARMRRKMPKADFDQEFNCIFQTDVGMAFDFDVLKRAIKKDLKAENYIDLQTYYAGLDLGKHEDATVLSIFKLEKVKDKLVFIQADIYEWRNEDWDVVIRELGKIIERYHLKGHVYADRLNVGDVVVDLLKPFDVRPIIPDIQQKQDAVDKLTKMMEEDALWLLEHELQAGEMMNYERKKTPSGRYSFHHPKGEHDDYVTANMMAALAMYEEIEAGDIVYESGESLGIASGLSIADGKMDSESIPLGDNKPYNQL